MGVRVLRKTPYNTKLGNVEITEHKLVKIN